MSRLLTLAFLPAGAAFAQDLTLVRDGRAQAAIVVEEGATAAEEYGAGELREHLRRMSDAKLEIVRKAPSGGRGNPARSRLGAWTRGIPLED